MNRDVGGSDHGMSLATKASFGFMAQNKDDAVQLHPGDGKWGDSTQPLQVTIVDNDIHTFILNTNHMPQRIVVEQLEIIILKETPIAKTGYKFIKTDHSLVVPPTRTSMR